MIAQPRQVADDQRARLGAGDRANVVRHLADVDSERVVVAEDRVPDRITDEDDVDPGVVGDTRERGIVGGHHDDRRRALGPFARGNRRD